MCIRSEHRRRRSRTADHRETDQRHDAEAPEEQADIRHGVPAAASILPGVALRGSAFCRLSSSAYPRSRLCASNRAPLHEVVRVRLQRCTASRRSRPRRCAPAFSTNADMPATVPSRLPSRSGRAAKGFRPCSASRASTSAGRTESGRGAGFGVPDPPRSRRASSSGCRSAHSRFVTQHDDRQRRGKAERRGHRHRPRATGRNRPLRQPEGRHAQHHDRGADIARADRMDELGLRVDRLNSTAREVGDPPCASYRD